MQPGRIRAEPRCYLGLDEPGGLPCLFLFIHRGSNRLRRLTMRPNPGTEPSMAKVGWTVQSAFYGRNSHATRESISTPCREAAQSNPGLQVLRRGYGEARRTVRQTARARGAL